MSIDPLSNISRSSTKVLSGAKYASTIFRPLTKTECAFYAPKVIRPRTSKVARMAREIVSLVERIDGPVPLNRIDEHVSGFRAPHGPSWSYFMRHSAGEAVLWDGMTKAGYKALRHVLNEREVALQLVNALPYIFENVRLIDPDWQPVLLLPVRAANINGPHWAFRVPPALAPQMMLRLASDDRYRPLIPRQVGSTADRFCVPLT
jgi:hypothetical protein